MCTTNCNQVVFPRPHPVLSVPREPLPSAATASHIVLAWPFFFVQVGGVPCHSNIPCHLHPQPPAPPVRSASTLGIVGKATFAFP